LRVHEGLARAAEPGLEPEDVTGRRPTTRMLFRDSPADSPQDPGELRQRSHREDSPQAVCAGEADVVAMPR